MSRSTNFSQAKIKQTVSFPLFIEIPKTFSNLNLLPVCVRLLWISFFLCWNSCCQSVMFLHTSVNHMFPQSSHRRHSFTQPVLWMCICMLLSMCICVKGTSYLTQSKQEPLILPCGVVWPICPQRSLYIGHNKNGQAPSHLYDCPTALSSKKISQTLPLLCTAMSPGFH